VLVGAGGAVIGQARNTLRTGQTACITPSCKLLLAHMPEVRQNEGRLTLYSSLEPCVMVSLRR